MRTCPTCNGEGKLQDEKVLAIERVRAQAIARSVTIKRWSTRAGLLLLCAASFPGTMIAILGVLRLHAFLIHSPMYYPGGEMQSGYAMLMGVGLLLGAVALASSIAAAVKLWE